MPQTKTRRNKNENYVPSDADLKNMDMASQDESEYQKSVQATRDANSDMQSARTQESNARRRRVEVLRRELAEAEAIHKEMKATVPDPDLGPKGVRSKYPPGVVANIKAKRDSLRAELDEAEKAEPPDKFVARKLQGN